MSLDHLVCKIIQWCQTPRIYLTAIHIYVCDNVEADHLSHCQVENPCWLDCFIEWFLVPGVTVLFFDF